VLMKGRGRGRGCVAFTASMGSQRASYKVISSIERVGVPHGDSAGEGKKQVLSQLVTKVLISVGTADVASDVHVAAYAEQGGVLVCPAYTRHTAYSYCVRVRVAGIQACLVVLCT